MINKVEDIQAALDARDWKGVKTAIDAFRDYISDQCFSDDPTIAEMAKEGKRIFRKYFGYVQELNDRPLKKSYLLRIQRIDNLCFQLRKVLG